MGVVPQAIGAAHWTSTKPASGSKRSIRVRQRTAREELQAVVDQRSGVHRRSAARHDAEAEKAA
jgi:hypothetical protein